MSDRHKRIAAFCLIVGGLVLAAYNFLRSTPPAVHGQEVEEAIYLDSLWTLEASRTVPEQEAEILALFVLKSSVCPPCVNNTLDYIELLGEITDKNIASTALFVEEDEEEVHRFMQITGLPVPYCFATEDLVPRPLQNSLQQLLFINVENEEIFYRLTIPGNVTSSLEYKRNVLDRVFSRWEAAG